MGWIYNLSFKKHELHLQAFSHLNKMATSSEITSLNSTMRHFLYQRNGIHTRGELCSFLSTECSRDKPLFSFVRGQDSTMCDIVWISPQGHRSVSVSRHFLLQAPQCPCSVQKRFTRDNVAEGGLTLFNSGLSK